MKNTILLGLLLCMAHNFSHAATTDESKRFYVVNTDQNKLIVVDHETYQTMKKRDIEDKFAVVRQEIGKTLPESISIRDSIERISQEKDAIITFIDGDESHVQFRMNDAQEVCEILTSKHFESERFSKRFGKFVSYYLPKAKDKLKKMKAIGKFILSLADDVIDVAEGAQRVASSIKGEVENKADSVIGGGLKVVSGIENIAGKIDKELSHKKDQATVIASAAAGQVQGKAEGVQQAGKEVQAAVQQKVSSAEHVLSKYLNKITKDTKELYLFEYNNSVFLTSDQERAIAGIRKNDMQELELTMMPTPNKRQFKKQNIDIAKQVLQRVPQGVDIVLYYEKNKVAKMKYQPSSGVQKILYYNDQQRDIVKNRFGTAIRYLINLNSDTKAFEAMLLKA